MSVIGFEIKINGGEFTNEVRNVGMLPYIFSDTDFDTEYSISRRAYDQWGNRSAWSAESVISTMPEPVAAVLDEISSTALIAVGLRKLSGDHIGQCLRVKRASDNAETDIGFAGNEIDVSALSGFGSSTTLSLVKLYDQSGNGRDLTSAMTNPAVTVDGGQVVITWSNSIMQTAGNVPTTAPKVFVVINSADILTNNYIYDCGSNNFHAQFNGGIMTIYNGTPADKAGVATGKQQLSIIFKAGNDEAYKNGEILGGTPADAGSTAHNSQISLGNYGGTGYPFIGQMFEFILFDGDIGTDQTIIEVNQMTFYGI